MADPAAVERTVNRLYSLYPTQVKKLKALSKLTNISQSEYLRQLIDVAYIEKIQQPKFERERYYGQADDGAA